MHIAMYAPALPSTASPNGIVTYVGIMQPALRSAGHRVTVFDRFSIEHSDGRIEQLGPDRRVPARLEELAARLGGGALPRWPVKFRHVIERIHATNPIDVLEIEESFGWAGRITVDAPVVARLHGPHLFVKDEHEPPDIARISAARVRAERASLQHTAAVTAPSSRLLSQTVRHYQIEPAIAAVIRNPMPLSTPVWSIDRAQRAALLFVGRFDLCKGADLALRAFAMAARDMPELTLMMCGPDHGIVDEAGTRRSFDAWAAAHLSHDCRRKVTFVGTATPDCLAELRIKSSLMIAMSRFEASSYSVAEALSCGLPVMLSDAVGLREVLTPGESAFTFANGDVHGAARAIVAALADRERLAAVGAGGRAACAEHLSPDRVAAETIAFYEQVLARR